jgi:hypothetical protein
MQRKQLLAILRCYPNLREKNTPRLLPTGYEESNSLHLITCQHFFPLQQYEASSFCSSAQFIKSSEVTPSFAFVHNVHHVHAIVQHGWGKTKIAVLRTAVRKPWCSGWLCASGSGPERTEAKRVKDLAAGYNRISLCLVTSLLNPDIECK